MAHARQEMVRLDESRCREIDEAMRKAIKEYRLPNNCFQRKEAYVSCFPKLGFYLGRSLLESRCPTESFLEMVFSKIASLIDAYNWRKYEPDSCDPDEYIKAALADDLANLSRLWSLYIPNLEDFLGIIEALHVIKHGLDEPKGAP